MDYRIYEIYTYVLDYGDMYHDYYIEVARNVFIESLGRDVFTQRKSKYAKFMWRLSRSHFYGYGVEYDGKIYFGCAGKHLVSIMKKLLAKGNKFLLDKKIEKIVRRTPSLPKEEIGNASYIEMNIQPIVDLNEAENHDKKRAR